MPPSSVAVGLGYRVQHRADCRVAGVGREQCVRGKFPDGHSKLLHRAAASDLEAAAAAG